MATAVLKIVGDSGGLTAALAEARRASRATSVAVAADARRTEREQIRAARAAEREQVRAARTAEREQIRATQNAARAHDRESKRAVAAQLAAYRQITQAARLSATARERAEKEATRIAQAEASARGLTATQEAELRARALRGLTSQAIAEERRMTAAARREATERSRFAARATRVVSAVGGAVVGAGSTIHSEIQATRRRRAGTESTLNDALYQAGVGGTEAAQMRARVMQFANARGMDPQAVAEGILQAQTQFSVLAQPGMSPQQALQQQLDLAGFAQDTRQDPGEVMRVAGMLGQQGITGADQRAALMQMTGMAHAGSIELASMTREAMGPLMQNIARSVTSGMNPQERAAAVRAATMETMAVGEVTARSGGRSRDMLNALAKTRGSITNDRTQENLYERLRGGGAQERALAASMFEQRDGHARLRQGTTAVGFLSQIVSGLGGDTNRAMNLLSAGGPGAPMILDAQQRRLMLLLASQGTGGRTIAENVSQMQTQGLAFNEQRVQQGHAMAQGEAATQLQREENARSEALGNNTSALNKLSNSIAGFAASNPLLSVGMNAGGSILGNVLAGRAGAVAAPLLARGGALGTSVLARLGAGVATGGAAGAGTAGAGVAAALGVAGGVGYGINRAMGNNNQADNPFSSHFYTDFAWAVRTAIREGLSSATVQVDPHAATQASATASTQMPRR